jgi:glycerophosphoryl diester phosphodiesterase
MLVIGHRGASVAARENSVQAFQLADAMGADGVELDVRRSVDGRLLIHHDPLPADLRDPLYDELAMLPAVLSACGEMLVNVEIKNSDDEPGYDPTYGVVEETIAEMRRHGPADRWVISSFDWQTIQRSRAVASDLRTAYLVYDATVDVVERTAAAGHVAVHPWAPTITPEIVDRCHGAGLAVNTWTSNDPVRIIELADLGVDGVCTDVPDVALAALGRRLGPVRAEWGRPA